MRKSNNLKIGNGLAEGKLTEGFLAIGWDPIQCSLSFCLVG